METIRHRKQGLTAVEAVGALAAMALVVALLLPRVASRQEAERATFTADQSGSIRGRVVSKGKPVANARVHLARRPGIGRRSDDRFVTDANGEFYVKYIEMGVTGEAEFDIILPGRDSMRHRVDIVPGETVEYESDLPPWDGIVEGVVSFEGDALLYLFPIVFREDGSFETKGSHLATELADGRWNFRMALPAGKAMLFFTYSHDGHEYTRPITVPVRSGETTRMETILGEGASSNLKIFAETYAEELELRITAYEGQVDYRNTAWDELMERRRGSRTITVDQTEIRAGATIELPALPQGLHTIVVQASSETRRPMAAARVLEIPESGRIDVTFILETLE